MAAITAASLTSGGTGLAASSFNTASVSPSANQLVLVTVSNASTSAPTGITGAGMTWVQESTASSDQHTTTVFRGLSASPSSGALTINFAGSQDRCSWSVDQFANVNTSGSNGSGAIVQSVPNNSGGSNVSTLTATLAAFGNVDNATFGASGWNGNSGATAITEGAGFTELADNNGNAGGFYTITETEFKSTNDTSVDSSTSSTGRYTIIGIEIANVSTQPASGNDYAYFI